MKTQAGYAGIAIDRNEVESVRATLKQTIATHAHTLDHLATAVAMFDKDRRLQFYNSSFQKLFGLAPSFLESQPDNAQVLDAIRAERKLPEVPDWRKWREGQLEIYKALEAREDWWHMPDGRTLRVVVNPHNQGGATWVFENVTEQLELRTNYNSLMQIQGETLDNLSEAVAVFGSDGRLKLCNPAFQSIWNLRGGTGGKRGAYLAAFANLARTGSPRRRTGRRSPIRSPPSRTCAGIYRAGSTWPTARWWTTRWCACRRARPCWRSST